MKIEETTTKTTAPGDKYRTFTVEQKRIKKSNALSDVSFFMMSPLFAFCACSESVNLYGKIVIIFCYAMLLIAYWTKTRLIY